MIQPYLPLPLVLIQQPFDHPDYLFEVKYDGWRCREMPLIERKQALRRIVPKEASRLLYADHVDAAGVDLFHAVCAHDIEGIVAKQKNWPYRSNGKISPG